MTRATASALITVSALALSGVAISTGLRPSSIVHPRSGVQIAVPGQSGRSTLLHNGWSIEPYGQHTTAGDMPLGGAVSPDGRLAAIATCGFGAHAVHVMDMRTGERLVRAPVVRAWSGLAWAPAGDRFYVSGGRGNPQCDAYCFVRDGERWERSEGIRLVGPALASASISGLAVSADAKTLYVLNMADDRLYSVDLETRTTLASVEVGRHPVACVAGKDPAELYVALWGGGKVAKVRVSDPRRPVVEAQWEVGSHPNSVALDERGRLFVACGNDDVVDVLETSSGKRAERIRMAVNPRLPRGHTPNAVAISGERLYVANADSNNVCVVDISRRDRSRVLGFIPTGWYPTAVLAAPDGRILVGSGKGTGSRPNPARLPINPIVPAGFEYIGNQLTGLLSLFDAPDERQLAELTRRVVALMPDGRANPGGRTGRGASAIPLREGGRSPIRYVLYIIKENRTYDQVFGDIPQGNGDPDLCLFGRDVTPNQHALAEEFVLLDNLYCTGEVSVDGHPWSTMAYATDHTQRSWVLQYSGKGPLPDAGGMGDAPTGFIWQACKARGITFRSYGEYSGHRSLEGSESLAFVGKAGPGSAPAGRDTERADIFIREFGEFERKGTMPRFMVMSLGENHTNGTRPGSYTPRAMVASNDLALGRIVEAVSRSSLWPQFAIFVIEDDAQNGPDHVDSHRTVGLVISPYARRRHVESTMYSTTSMLRTMELILGLPPLTQHDAVATPMHACFTSKPDLRPYTALPARINLEERNPANAYGAARSARMDWSEYDRINEDELNRILWHSIKGRHVPYPPPVRTALIGAR